MYNTLHECYIVMAEKIARLGKRSLKTVLFIWSGILTFILNLLGCEHYEPVYYAPLFYGDFKATGTAIDKDSRLPVKGIKVSVHLVDDVTVVQDVTPVSTDITDDNGNYELNVENVDVKEFIVYFHDTDPDSDGNYSDEFKKVEMPEGQETYLLDFDPELSEVDE